MVLACVRRGDGVAERLTHACSDGEGTAAHVEQGRMLSRIPEVFDQDRAEGRDDSTSAALEEYDRPLTPELDVEKGLLQLWDGEGLTALHSRLVAFDVLEQGRFFLIAQDSCLHWRVGTAKLGGCRKSESTESQYDVPGVDRSR